MKGIASQGVERGEILGRIDIITEINGQSMDDPEKIMKLVRSLKVGDKVNMILYREMETLKVEFNLPERPILPGDLFPDSSQSPSGGIKGFKSFQ